MEKEPRTPKAPTSIDQHQIGQLKSQIGSLAADIRQLTQVVQKLVDTEAARAAEMKAFAEDATNVRGIVLQAASMMREAASRSERQLEAMAALTAAFGKLTNAANGVLDLSIGFDRVRQVVVDRPVETKPEDQS